MGWATAKFGDVCDFVRGPFGGALKKSIFKETGYAVYEQQHAINNQFEKIRYFVDEDKFQEMSRFELFPGDLIMSCSGTMGKVAITPGGVPRGIINQALLKLSPKENLDPVFLKLWMESRNFQEQVESMAQGVAIKNMASVKVLKEIEIPIPLIPEQKRIVAILDQAFADIDKARVLTEQNLNNARELFESYLQQVFSQRGEGWEEKKWGSVCNFIRGPFGGSLKKSMFKEEGYAVYEQKHAIHDHIEQIRYFVDGNKFEEMRRFEVKPGELIMSCSGVTLGRVSVIPEGAPKGIINQALLKLTPHKDMDVHFLKYWIRSKIFQDIIFEHSGGAAIPNVPAAKLLKEITLSIPSFQKQRKVVREIDSILSETSRVAGIYKTKIESLDELKKSLLQKAFTGELTGSKIQQSVA